MLLNLNLFLFLVGMAGIIVRGTEASNVVMVRLQNQEGNKCLIWHSHVATLWSDCEHSTAQWKLLVYEDGVLFQMDWPDNPLCLHATNAVAGSGLTIAAICNHLDLAMKFTWMPDGKIRLGHNSDLCIGKKAGNAEGTGIEVVNCTPPNGATGANLKWTDQSGNYVPPPERTPNPTPSPTVTPPIPSVPGMEEEVIMVTLQNQEDDKMCLHWSAVPGLYNDCDHSNKEWRLLRYSDDSGSVMFQSISVNEPNCLHATDAVVGSGLTVAAICDHNDLAMKFRWTPDGKIKLIGYPNLDLCIGKKAGNAEGTGIEVVNCTPPNGASGAELLWKDSSGNYVPPEEPDPSCRDATFAINEKYSVHEAYMKLVNSTDQMDKQEIDNQTVLFDDFSLAKYEGRIHTYETKCEAMQGAMVLLNYKLECSKSDEVSVTVFVGDQPRCYSKFCDDDSDLSMDEALFQKFAIQETQDRANEDHAVGLNTDEWTCTGNLFNYKAPMACEYQSEKIATSDAMVDLSHLLTPKVENAKLFWIIPSPFPTSNQIVTLPNKSELKGPCEESGGVVAEFPEVRVECTDPSKADENAAVFEVKGHACFGNMCDYTRGGANLVVGNEVRNRLVQAGILGMDMICTVSGAIRLSISTAVGSIMLVWWYMF
jgi:hypothetical protein